MLEIIKMLLSVVLSLLTALGSLLGFGVQPVQKEALRAPQDAIVQTLDIMSFNVYVAGVGKKSPKKRTSAVVQTILTEAPDSVGLQEVDEGWYARLVEELGKASYKAVGIGRDKNNTGEASPIFYNAAVYTLLDSGTFWLSETPEKPSRGWDAVLNRVCTWALLQDRETGFTYAHFNAHLDHMGKNSRYESAQLIVKMAEQLVAPEIPVVLTGDFNAKQGDKPYRVITKNGYYDTKTIANQADSGATYHAYSAQDAWNSRPIDYVFASHHVREVASYRILRDKVNSIYPSDHYAVVAQVTLAQQAATPDVTRVMSFNLLYGGEGERDMFTRVDRVVNTVLSVMPDSFGVQEAHYAWIRKLVDRLPQYGYVGIGRDDGLLLGEFSAVFYRKDTYTVADSGTFWISETPQKPSVGWDASTKRICTWAVLQNKETGEQYAQYNAHLDHVGEQSRLEGVRLIRERAGSQSIPVVLTGDFNMRHGTQPWQEMVQNTFVDAREAAADTMDGATYHNFNKADIILDYIFFAESDWTANTFRILNDKMLGGYASDHFAIYADLVRK